MQLILSPGATDQLFQVRMLVGINICSQCNSLQIRLKAAAPIPPQPFPPPNERKGGMEGGREIKKKKK